jgi:hypothetical protein
MKRLSRLAPILLLVCSIGCTDTSTNPAPSSCMLIEEFDVADSLQRPTRIFHVGDRLCFIDRIVSACDSAIRWGCSEGRPPARFEVFQGNARIYDSFEGIFFTHAPESGILAPRQSIRSIRAIALQSIKFAPGRYTAVSTPQWGFAGQTLHVKYRNFEVLP